MSIMIQIRNVPDAVHRKAKSRAAMAGMSLSDYLLNELKRSLETPVLSEMLERLSQRKRVELRPSAADVIRQERDER